MIGDDFLDYIQKARQLNIIIPDDVYNLLIDCVEERPLALREIKKMMQYIEDRQAAIFESISSPLPPGKFSKILFCILRFAGHIFCILIKRKEKKKAARESAYQLGITSRPSTKWKKAIFFTLRIILFIYKISGVVDTFV